MPLRDLFRWRRRDRRAVVRRARGADRAGRSAPPARAALRGVVRARRARAAVLEAQERADAVGRPEVDLRGEPRAASRRAATSGVGRGRSPTPAARAACRRAGTRPLRATRARTAGTRAPADPPPSWWRSSSTRASEAAVSVSAQPEAPRPFVPTSSRQRSSASCSSAASASSSSGCTTSSSSFGPLWASASVAPTTTLLTSCGSASMNSERVSSEPTIDDLGCLQPPDDAVELRGDVLQVLGDELLDVPRVARLRPAALIVPARLVLGPVDDLLEPPGAEAKDLAALASDERDDRAVVAADELRERREVEAAADVHVVRNRARDRQRPEEVARREHAQPASTFTAELVVEELPDPGEVPLQTLPLGVRQLVVTGLDPLLGLREERVDPGVDGGRGRAVRRIEVDVEADRAASVRTEARELAEGCPGQLFGHGKAVLPCAGRL